MALDFLKGNESETPPDVGKEDEYEERKRKAMGERKTSDAEKKRDELRKKGEELINQIETGKTSEKTPSVSNEKTRFEFEKINARIEAMNSLMKGFNERFSNVNQQIGEIRAMTLNNEKLISKTDQDALKAVDIVKEVQPDKLRLDFQRIEMRMNSLDEKLTANKQYAENLMTEFKEIKRKAGIFEGGESIMRLNEDVKKDMVELQKMGAKVRMNADKSEQIFIELKKNFAESGRLNQIIDNLDNSYSGLKKEIEKLKLDYSTIIKLQEFEGYKKQINSKISLFENLILEMDKMKSNNERIMELFEKTLFIAKKNQEDVANIAITIGDDKIKRVSDYEDELSSILKIIDSIAGQVSIIKKKIGMESEKKIPVEPVRQKVINDIEVKMKNLEIHPNISKPLISKKPDVEKDVEEFNSEMEERNTEADERLKELEELQSENRNMLGVFKKKQPKITIIR